MKLFEAHKGIKFVPPDGTALRNPDFCRVVIGVLLVRLGQPQTITQEDLNTVHGLAVMEGRSNSGDFMVGLGRKPGATS